MALEQTASKVWTIVLIGFFIGAGILALAQFRDSVSATDLTARSGINYSIEGISNIAEQLPTVGTIIGVLIIIAAVIGMVVYFRGRGGY